MGLSLGADDYLRKPFGAAELRAKVAARLRREHREHGSVLTVGRVRFDLKTLQVSVDPTMRELPVPTGMRTDARLEFRREPHFVPLTPTECEGRALAWVRNADAFG